ncbi:MAG: cysteine--tRNA ligase [Deferribacteraceae bacterium]|jgi:cysteinyl-tRNA synthetase|nr:cysteine--tRNA ligase [Deferribacteraceae bacterium]
MLHIYNTMSAKKELFKPVSDGNIKMYVCGVTVYDLCHIGHARSAVAFDVVRRGLEWLGMSVTYVKNFTDIDDKIINKSNATGRPWQEITAEYIQKHNEDMDRIGVLRPSHAPLATQYIKEMVEFCEKLITGRRAYESNGDIYYRVSSFNSYGKLSRRNADDLLAGARVDVNEQKENPLDFALWKAAKPNEPSWESPWGKGRPGWHIECSVMSEKILQSPIDIHGGGQDLIFPHHENEIAQSEATSGRNLAKYWMHNGFVNINKEKMSKSLGNFFTIRDILEDTDPETLRFFLLTTHYRQPLEFADSKLIEAESSLDRIYTFKDELANAIPSKKGANDTAAAEEIYEKFYKDYKNALEDDFNTPAMLAALFDAVRMGNTLLINKVTAPVLETLRTVCAKMFADVENVLFVAYKNSDDWYKSNLSIPEKELNTAIESRNAARKEKNFEGADRIRQELAAKGVELVDTPTGTRYRTKRQRTQILL